MPTPSVAAGDRVSVVVAGSAIVSGANIEALLSNWLRLGSDNPVKEARFYLPCTTDTLTTAVRETAMAILSFDHPGITYSVVVDAGADGLADKKIERNADLIIDTADLPGALIGEIVGDADEVGDDGKPLGVQPYVILAWGPQDEAPDELSYELITAANRLDIPVLEIAANGLDTLILDTGTTEAEAGNPAETETEAEPNEELREAARANADLLKVAEAAGDEAQAQEIAVEVLKAAEAADEPTMPVIDALAHSLAFLRALDKAHAIRNKLPDYESPLTSEIHRTLKQAMREADALPKTLEELEASIASRKANEAAQAVSEPPEGASVTPVTKGRSRAKTHQVGVFVDQDGTIVRLAGRGPTPRGLTRRFVPFDEVPEHLRAS